MSRIGSFAPRHAAMCVMLILLVARPASAQVCDERATIVQVGEAGELTVDRRIEGTTVLRLASIVVPDALSAAAAVPRRSIAEQARETLALLSEGRSACLLLFERRRDRYGRLLAHVYGDGALWLQGELLRRGLARVQPTPDMRALAAEMLEIERRAREAGAGLWGDERFRVRSPANAGRWIGSFQLVEGRVLEAARRQDRWYLNFGSDWRSDFTVSVPKDALPDFAERKLDLYSLKGRTIRVRGWVESLNGPMIEVVQPEQIEMLDGPAG